MNKVLVPISFSDYTDILLSHAVKLCKEIDASLNVLFVLDIPGFLEGYMEEASKEKIREDYKKKLAQLVETYKNNTGIAIESIFKEGKIHKIIEEVCSDVEIDFTLIGANESQDSTTFIGANTVRIVQTAASPIISVKGKVPAQFLRNIILPLDLTKDTSKKVKMAIDICKRFKEISLKLVSVVNSDDYFVVKRLSRHMEIAKKEIQDNGIRCAAEIIKVDVDTKNIAHQIVNYADKSKGDLIMIMTQEEKNPVQFFIGSMAQQLINQDKVPVLSVSP